MRALTFAMMLVFSSACLLQAGTAERMRSDAQDISINTKSLSKQKKATAQYEIPPFFEFIANLLKLIFHPNGDIEINNPYLDVPEVEGTLDDDSEPEQYVDGQDYEALNPDDYEDYSFIKPSQPQPQPQPQVQPQPQPQPQPNVQQVIPGGENNGPGIPPDLKRKALAYFNSNTEKIRNRRFIGVVDFAKHSSRQRFWILDVQTGAEHAMRVAHGSGSDPDGDGYATKFSNTHNSHSSSLGFYVTGPLYTGKHGKSMRLVGLSSTNSNALARAVVVHESAYVREANVRQGRSWGCLAVSRTEIANVLASLKGGALIYAGLSNSEF